jgi:hypothetical protein
MRASAAAGAVRSVYEHSTYHYIQSERVFGRFIRFYAALQP